MNTVRIVIWIACQNKILFPSDSWKHVPLIQSLNARDSWQDPGHSQQEISGRSALILSRLTPMRPTFHSDLRTRIRFPCLLSWIILLPMILLALLELVARFDENFLDWVSTVRQLVPSNLILPFVWIGSMEINWGFPMQVRILLTAQLVLAEDKNLSMSIRRNGLGEPILVSVQWIPFLSTSYPTQIVYLSIKKHKNRASKGTNLVMHENCLWLKKKTKMQLGAQSSRCKFKSEQKKKHAFFHLRVCQYTKSLHSKSLHAMFAWGFPWPEIRICLSSAIGYCGNYTRKWLGRRRWSSLRLNC